MSNFNACLEEAIKNLAWLNEHKFTQNLSLLQLEIDAAMRETSKDRGGFMQHVLFSMAPQEALQQPPVDQELQVTLKKMTKSSGWPLLAYDENVIGNELLNVMKSFFATT